jgi:hypothetical protein
LQVDPFLRLVEDSRLQALDSTTEPCYGSKQDDDLALKSLSNIDMNEEQSKETSVSNILNSLEELSEVMHIKFMIYLCLVILRAVNL